MLQNKTIKLEELRGGDVFEHDNEYYIRIHRKDHKNCMRLRGDKVCFVDHQAQVTLLSFREAQIAIYRSQLLV